MFEKRKYFDYKLAYKMYEKCKKLLAKGGIDELDEYFEEMTERDNGYTYYYGSDYNAWVYIINENFDTDKEEETWLNGKEGLVVSGEVDIISYGSGEDTLFINNIEDIEERINGLLDYAKANNYTIEDYEKELESLEWVLETLKYKEIYENSYDDYTNFKKTIDKLIKENNTMEDIYKYIKENLKCDITNCELTHDFKYIDVNYKNITISVLQHDNKDIYVGNTIEIWNDKDYEYIGVMGIKALEDMVEKKNHIDNVLDKVIEIEDYNGNTIFSFMVDEKGNITKYNNCSVADITDDYIFNTDKLLMRIQKEEE